MTDFSPLDTLKDNVAVAQFIAYTCLTLTTALVAALSLRFTYRQHYGWKPFLLLVTRGMKGLPTNPNETSDVDGMPLGFYAWLQFDLWNRHNYPIVVEYVAVRFTQDILDRSNDNKIEKDAVWFLAGEEGYRHVQRFVLDAGKHHSFDLSAKMKVQNLDTIDGDVIVSVTYFDPRKRKSVKMLINHVFNFKPNSTKKKFLLF